jgi:hypothetical protein
MLVRKAGGNHFNAKEKRVKQLNKKRGATLIMSNKDRGRFMPHS